MRLANRHIEIVIDQTGAVDQRQVNGNGVGAGHQANGSFDAGLVQFIVFHLLQACQPNEIILGFVRRIDVDERIADAGLFERCGHIERKGARPADDPVSFRQIQRFGAFAAR